jgi:hypothetical protein
MRPARNKLLNGRARTPVKVWAKKAGVAALNPLQSEYLNACEGCMPPSTPIISILEALHKRQLNIFTGLLLKDTGALKSILRLLEGDTAWSHLRTIIIKPGEPKDAGGASKGVSRQVR